MDLFHTHISERSVELATEALRSTFVSEGKLVREFEAALASKLGLLRPVTVNSGTTALHLALDLAGVGPGDEVILPAQTFVATGLAILMQRATPVFADIDARTGNLSAADAIKRITPRTRAIMPVHWAGEPCEMDAINTLASKHNLTIVEDAAHALGATYHGKPVGSLSRFTCFSFQAIKHLTTGDGGALCCADAEDETLARQRRWFGIDRKLHQPDILGERVYDLDHVGYKYHLNDLAAAVGLGNLQTFPHRLARRREIDATYRRELASVPGVTLLDRAPDTTSACWLFSFRVRERENLIRKLAADRIPSSVVHRRIDRNSVFGGARHDLPGQELFEQEQLCLPLHEALTDDDVRSVIHCVSTGW